MFLILVILTLILIHGYVGLRIIPTLNLTGHWPLIVWICLAILTILPILPIILRVKGYENMITDALSWIGYTSLGFFSLALIIIVTRDILWLFGGGAVKTLTYFNPLFGMDGEAASELDNSRRMFIVRAMNLGILGITGGLSAYGFLQARREAQVVEKTIPIKNLPASLNGFKIVQISDLHVGPTIKADYVQKIVDKVQELEPDLIAMTGDLVDGSVNYLSKDIAPLAELRARYGKFFVTGNHEYYSGVQHWLKEVKRVGFTNLVNQNQVVDVNGARLSIAGVTDLTAHQVVPSHKTDPDAAMAGVPADSVKLMLAHQPAAAEDAHRLGVDLMLSGHTHGGQFRPFNLVVAKVHTYIAGLYNHKGTWVYVNSGTGYWGPPLRLGIPSEITVLKLKQA